MTKLKHLTRRMLCHVEHIERCIPEPPATLDSCAKPTDGGFARKTEYTFFYKRCFGVKGIIIYTIVVTYQETVPNNPAGGVGAEAKE